MEANMQRGVVLCYCCWLLYRRQGARGGDPDPGTT